MKPVPFSIPYTCKESAVNVMNLIQNPVLVNKGYYIKKCSEWFEQYYPDYAVFLTTSCTRALEIISLSLNLSVEDEIILSPFNYVGVGNAFANYGAKLVFVDMDKDTMNIDASLIEKAITKNTRAIVAMHYASIPCELDKIKNICDKYNLILIEDNAQGIHTSFNDRLLGSVGDFSCISFDMLKNISCNEGGVLLCRKEWADKVDVVYNNGTNKTAFSRGLVGKYEWISKGSKFAMSEYTAAVLLPLLEQSAGIIAQRKEIWRILYAKITSFKELRPYIPQVLLENDHNAHLAYLKFDSKAQRDKVSGYLNQHGVPAAFHYIPLDASAYGSVNSASDVPCANSLIESERLLRLPMHNFLQEDDLNRIVEVLKSVVETAGKKSG